MRQLTSLDAQFLGVETAADLRARRRPRRLRPVDRAGRHARDRRRLPDGLRAPAPAAAVPLAAGRGAVRARPALLGRGPGLRPRLPHPRDARCRRRATTASWPRPSRGSSPARSTARRPLWELYLIHGLEGGRVALLTKIHHSVVDGVSGNEILGVLLDPSPEGRELPPTPAGEPRRARARRPRDARPRAARPAAPAAAGAALAADGAAEPDRPARRQRVPGVPTLSRGWRACARALGAASDPAMLEVTTARPPKTTLQRPRLGRTAASRSARSRSTRSRRLKNELGITVNDVVVALCAGAVRDWLLERDELPDEPLVAMIPVSVRTEERGAAPSATGSRR